MEAAADYSFNRSHAACYALISYRTAWLRANYPAEYMAALISTVMSTKDKVPFFVNRCAEMGIEVLPPDVNASDHGFVVSGKSIRFGLDAVKNVGHAAVQAIITARTEDGEFTSIYDFCERVDNRAVNKRAVECLVKCGALDSTGATRRGMLEALPMAAAAGQKAQEDTRLGQGSIFDLGGGGGAAGGASARAQHPPVGLVEFEKTELLSLEKETLGTYLSSHPLADVRDALRAKVDCSISALGEQGGRVVRHGRRDRHRVQAPQDQARRPDGLRDPRRHRGPGRDAGARQVLHGLDRVPRPRRDRRGPGPDRPPGARPDEDRHHRGRALRADRGRGRARAQDASATGR